MEGYSVTEAASVLGVPTERVWELLARGVLSGAPEGETGMRVYLQPRPAPAAVEAKGPNGNGGEREPERELSPFRELLTEFRNLTERYGQALLALGEARGEVAALRSRVDLLEARMDLRLPMGPPQAAAWSSSPTPLPVEQAVMPAAPVEAGAEAPVDARIVPGPSEEAAHSDEEERRARARGPRRATESFAEALARAEDPSPPELPGGMEAAAALAAMRQQSEAGSDIGLPRDVAGADEIPIAEAVETVADGPEPVDEASEVIEQGHATFEPAGDPVPLESVAVSETGAEAWAPAEPVEVETEADAEVETEPELDAEGAAEALAQTTAGAESAGLAAEPEAGTAAGGQAEPEVEGAGSPIASTDFEVEAEESEPEREPVEPEDAEPETEPVEPGEEEPEPEPFEPEPVPGLQAQPGDDAVERGEPAGADVEPIAWDADRYTTDIEEPDWFAAEIDEAVQTPSVAEETESEPPEPVHAAETVDAVEPRPTIESAHPVEAVAPAAEPVEDDGADEMEVAPTGTQGEVTPAKAAPPTRTARPFPGADDLEAAIAALRAAGRSAESPPPSEPLAEAESDEDEAVADWPPRSTFTEPPTTTSAATRGPASRAYRRLRRIFPG